MFERYTERARRVIFFSRYEASQFGSTAIEAEHLLLGLLREDRALIHRFLPATAVDGVSRKIEDYIPLRKKVSTSVDLPLSDESKRILLYANEESERLAHRFVGTEHLLLGILREETCFATRVLTEAGLEVCATRDQLAGVRGQPGPPPTMEPLPGDLADRASVHALVDRLPESALGRAHWMLQQLL
jgi:ATP-dependent Clp protease ATP-binding subunit ClpC